MNTIENLKWRYATKQFDSSKEVIEADIDLLKESIQLAASSYGLQFYKVIIVKDKALKELLRPASYGQRQITEASHLFVFCNYTDPSEADVDSFMKLNASTRGLNVADLKGYSDFVKGSMSYRSKENMLDWTAKQTYIALGNLLVAAAELKIDSCPMEGFEAEKYNDILDLTEKGLNAVVIAPVGYRSEEDQTQFAAKVRKPFSDLFEEM